jgi:hypothetical protein
MEFGPVFVIDGREPSPLGGLFLLIRYDPNAAATVADDVLGLLKAFHEYEKFLGGKGVSVGPADSHGGEGWLSLLLGAREDAGAKERFTKLVELLGVPVPLAEGSGMNPLGRGRTDLLNEIFTRFRQWRDENDETAPSAGTPALPDLKAFPHQVRFRFLVAQY